MIRIVQGDLLGAREEAIVNAVNTVGVMGKGLALQFKRRFPENFNAYAAACKRGEVRVGTMFVTKGTAADNPLWIINFPTKQDWRHPSKLEWIEHGLLDLKSVIASQSIRSIALPRLGCGLGGLNWNVVRPLIVTAFEDARDVDVAIYEPPCG